jgi:hypothetical protein
MRFVEIVAIVFLAIGVFVCPLTSFEANTSTVIKTSTTGDFKDGMNKVIRQLEHQTKIMEQQTEILREIEKNTRK